MKEINILILDDDSEEIEFTGAILSEQGYLIHMILEISTLIDAATKVIPSLIILKAKAEDTSTLDIIKQLRLSNYLKSVPFIILASDDREFEDVSSIINNKLGYEYIDLLRLPISKEDFLPKVNSLVIKENSELFNPDSQITELPFNVDQDLDTLSIEKKNEIKETTREAEDDSFCDSELEKFMNEEFSLPADKQGKHGLEGKINPLYRRRVKKGALAVLGEKSYLLIIIAILVMLLILTWFFVFYPEKRVADKKSIIEQKVEKPQQKAVTPEEPPVIVSEAPLVAPEADLEKSKQELVQKTPEKVKIEKKPKKTTQVRKKTPPRAKRLTSDQKSSTFLFSVQAGSFNVKSNARKLENRLKRKGYDAFIKEVNYKNGISYKVLIGRYNSLKEAGLTVKRLKKDENIDSFIFR